MEWYLESFTIPEDYQKRILKIYSQLNSRQVDTAVTKVTLESKLKRLKDLYSWGDIDLYDAYTADEAFVTSTSFCICPVSSVNGSDIADGGVPGPVTNRLMSVYSGLVGIDFVQQYLERL